MLKAVQAVAAVGDPISGCRCRPVDVTCRDAEGGEYTVRVKPVTEARLRAVAVAEAVAWGALRAVGLHVADPFVVSMSEGFAADLTSQCAYDPPVQAGRHWGTGVLAGIGLDESLTLGDLDQVGNPEHLFRIFLMDELTGNSDRVTDGNTLLVAEPDLPARLVAIDHSECFGGHSCLAVHGCLPRTRDERRAHHYSAMEALLLEKPPSFVDDEIRLVQTSRNEIFSSVTLPHEEWFELGGIDPEWVSEYLAHRAEQLGTLAQRDHWRGICELGQMGGLGA